jgi:hypothetical protein
LFRSSILEVGGVVLGLGAAAQGGRPADPLPHRGRQRGHRRGRGPALIHLQRDEPGGPAREAARGDGARGHGHVLAQPHQREAPAAPPAAPTRQHRHEYRAREQVVERCTPFFIPCCLHHRPHIMVLAFHCPEREDPFFHFPLLYGYCIELPL